MKKLIIILFLLPLFCFGQLPQRDKLMHFIAGGAIADASYLIAKNINNDHKKSFWISVGTSIGFGIAKEVWDINRTGFDLKDIGATALGGVSVSMSFTINERFKLKFKS